MDQNRNIWKYMSYLLKMVGSVIGWLAVIIWQGSFLNRWNSNSQVIACPYCGESNSSSTYHHPLIHCYGLYDDSKLRLSILYARELERIMPGVARFWRTTVHNALAGKSHLDFQRCKSCDLTFQNYPHTTLSARYFYTILYRLPWQEIGGIFGRDNEHWVSQQALIADYFLSATNLAKGAHILDVGCAEGWLCHTLEKRGMTAFGREPSDPMVNYAQNVLGLQRIVADEYYKDSYTANSFHGIISHHVAEHIIDIKMFFSALSLHLKPGGFLLLQVPCTDEIVSDASYKVVLTNDHIYGYSEQFLRQVFKSNGLEILECLRTPCDLKQLPEFQRSKWNTASWADDPCGISILARKGG
jgi:2-polyprenyl-3-methyl-5-hydroxy-6-metoxy-1,4-benzoquinol methylase